MLPIKVKGKERFLTFFDMMSAGKFVLLFTIILHISVPTFGLGLFWKIMNHAHRSNPIQFSALKENRVPESIKDQIEESIIRFARRRFNCL